MKMISLVPINNHQLEVTFDDGRVGTFDVSPFFQYEAFEPLQDPLEFKKIVNGSYYVEWDCGADLSIDTIFAFLK